MTARQAVETTGSTGQSEDAPADERTETERAEQVMEDLGARVGDWTSRAVARAREEAEDIWAEAQTIRRGDRRDA